MFLPEGRVIQLNRGQGRASTAKFCTFPPRHHAQDAVINLMCNTRAAAFPASLQDAPRNNRPILAASCARWAVPNGVYLISWRNYQRLCFNTTRHSTQSRLGSLTPQESSGRKEGVLNWVSLLHLQSCQSSHPRYPREAAFASFWPQTCSSLIFTFLHLQLFHHFPR